MAERKIAALIEAEAVKRTKDGRITDRAQRQIARLKAEAMKERLSEDDDARSFEMGRLRVEVDPCPMPRGASGDAVSYRLRIITEAGRLIHEEHHVVFNPPVMVRDGEDENGDPVLVEDHARALRQIVEGQVKRALGLGQ